MSKAEVEPSTKPSSKPNGKASGKPSETEAKKKKHWMLHRDSDMSKQGAVRGQGAEGGRAEGGEQAADAG